MSLIPAAYRGGPDSSDPIGAVVLGCRVERLLGRGGMGAVYLARREDGTPLVAKVLAPELVHNVRLRARFEREWEALRKLPPHPHLVRIEAVTSLGASPCILMEHVQGRTLHQGLRERGRFDPLLAAGVARQVAQAISVVHGHGLLHRDLTPNNVMLTEGGGAKVIDFGLAKDLFRTTLTAPGQMLGTVHYMAPEQLEGGDVEARSDVFALGATLYQLVTGAPPFEGSDLAEVVELIVEGEFALPSTRVPELPKAFDELLLQLLAPEVHLRHGSMQELAEDLDRILLGLPCSAPCLRGPELRAPLLGARRFLIGSEPGVPVRLDDSTVAPHHAQLRLERRGYVLYDLKSPSGTFVGEEPITTTPRLLEDGDRVRVGAVELRFEDPRSRRRVEPYLRNVARRALPAAAVEALAAQADPRALLWLLEGLCPGDVRRRVARALGGVLEASALEAVGERCQRRAEARAQAAGQRLALATGQPQSGDPATWIASWVKGRATRPVQVVPLGEEPELVLRALEGPCWPSSRAVGDPGVVLIGRDARCTVRLGEGGARLHATLVRLWRRVALRDDSGGATACNGAPVEAALLEPGDALTLGPVRVVVEAQAGDQHALTVDGDLFDALLDLEHPATASALARLASATLDWLPGLAAELFPWEHEARGRFAGSVREAYAFYRERARALLPKLGPQPRGPQLSPRGWLT